MATVKTPYCITMVSTKDFKRWNNNTNTFEVSLDFWQWKTNQANKGPACAAYNELKILLCFLTF